MITKITIGNIFESTVQSLVNTVNCIGIMGKGIALEFKNRFPEMFKDYQMRCGRNEVEPGKPYLYKGLFPPWIINFSGIDSYNRLIGQINNIIVDRSFTRYTCFFG